MEKINQQPLKTQKIIDIIITVSLFPTKADIEYHTSQE